MSHQQDLHNPCISFELSADFLITSMDQAPSLFSDETMLGKDFTSLISPENRDNFLEKVSLLTDKNPSTTLLYNIKADTGVLHTFQAHIQLNKKPKSYTIISMEISQESLIPLQTDLTLENKTLKARILDLEREVELQEQNYDVFVNNAPIAMYDIDLKSTIISSNKRALEFFHAKDTFDVKNQHYLKFVSEDDQERLQELFNVACQGKEQYFTFKANRKELQIFKSCFIPVYDYVGHVYKIFSLLEDVTKEKQAEALLKNKVVYQTKENQRKDRLIIDQSRHVQMGQLIQMIAHQWRQPLSLISTVAGNVEIMVDLDNLKKRELKESMKVINEQSQSLSKIITDFTDFYKPKKTKTKVLLRDIGDSVIEVMETSLHESGIDFKRESKAIHEFYTFKNEITQVLLNLLQNSQDMLKERNIKNPSIKLTGYETDQYQIIEVKDNAHGIDEAIIDKIFDPYFSTKQSKNGTGLGLHMAKTMIESHCDGTISVTNEDEGAKFTISLPNNGDNYS